MRTELRIALGPHGIECQEIGGGLVATLEPVDGGWRVRQAERHFVEGSGRRWDHIAELDGMILKSRAAAENVALAIYAEVRHREEERMNA